MNDELQSELFRVQASLSHYRKESKEKIAKLQEDAEFLREELNNSRAEVESLHVELNNAKIEIESLSRELDESKMEKERLHKIFKDVVDQSFCGIVYKIFNNLKK